MNTLEKAELSYSIQHIANSEVADTAGKKRQEREEE